MRQRGNLSNSGSTCERRSFFVITTLPAASTPCTWNTFLARSIPSVVTCMWMAPSCDSSDDDHPMALRCRERAPSTPSTLRTAGHAFASFRARLSESGPLHGQSYRSNGRGCDTGSGAVSPIQPCRRSCTWRCQPVSASTSLSAGFDSRRDFCRARRAWGERSARPFAWGIDWISSMTSEDQHLYREYKCLQPQDHRMHDANGVNDMQKHPSPQPDVFFGE
jgi:hypothetical protein